LITKVLTQSKICSNVTNKQHGSSVRWFLMNGGTKG